MKRSALVFAGLTLAAGLILLVPVASAQTPRSATALVKAGLRANCSENAATCTETADSIGYDGAYTGHDEPSNLFYSDTPGSGNSQFYQLTLPKDPPTAPAPDGAGGTTNFQLHPAFWFGMAMCDSQSAPNYSNTCTPDTDKNIFNNSDPNSSKYLGKHPGTAFMEMQFYPPGWVNWPAGDSCDSTRYCAALNIDSLSEDMNTGQTNNDACAEEVGLEPVNFAFITTSGKSHAPADPVSFITNPATATPNASTDLFMNPGDHLLVGMFDTFNGFTVQINDLTTGQVGSMTASAANGFGQIKYDPNGSGCTVLPYDFHPMYSTSSPATRVVWAAHSYNVAFSDEIGHWEYCQNVQGGPGGVCTDDPNDPPAGGFGDDSYCFLPGQFPMGTPIGGCLGEDDDFDGVPYQKVWPGTRSDPTADAKLHPQSVVFTSPLFFNGGGLQNYDRVAFETDLPRIEGLVEPPCNRNTGENCVNPPPGANFYPFYTTGTDQSGNCVWQLGGRMIPGTTNTFGGNSTRAFGALLQSTYPGPGFTPFTRYNNFRRIIQSMPCAASPAAQSFASVGGPR
jgi:hypothetical protein